MEIRKIYKASCPLTRSLFNQPILAPSGGRSGQISAYNAQMHYCSHYRFQSYNNRFQFIQCQARHAPIRAFSMQRIISCISERIPTSSLQPRMRYSRRTTPGSFSASVLSWPTPIRRHFVVSSRNYQPRTFSMPGPSGRGKPLKSSHSTTLPLTPSSTKTPVPTPFEMAVTQVAKYNDPSLITHLGRRKRHLIAMHLTRYRRQIKLIQRSQPRHSSQLLSINGLPLSDRNNRLRNLQKARRRIGVMKSSTNEVVQRSQYLPVKYLHPYGSFPRLRFMSMTDFLRHSRLSSLPGRIATKRLEKRKWDKLIAKKRGRAIVVLRPRIQEARNRLAYMVKLLEKGPRRLAIKEAITLIRSKQQGMKLPSGHEFLKLISLDQANYRRLQTTKMSSPVSSKSLETSLPIDPTLFTTQDINAILIRCEELRDWKSGWYISNTLLRRYQMPGFDFSASKFGAPNARTIHLLAKLFIRSNHFSRAEALFSVLHQSYPHPIPLDIYTAYLSELATKNQVSQIESTLRHLETAGPHPTVTQYNTLLRAIGRHRGVEQAEELFARMVQAGIVPDQQTYRILIDESLSDVDMAKAHSWLGKYMRQGFEINARMMEPFMNTCVNQVCLFESKESKAVVVDRVSLSHEWMLKAMNILHFMSRQELLPTARTFDLLMKGFLAQKNVSEVHNVLTLMRSSPYFYVPDPSIWISLFKYHLKRNEPLLALKALNDMGNSKDDLKPGEIPTGAVVPKALYRKLFRHYLKKDNLSMAERSLYEMLVQIKGTRPNEQDIIDLIWKLENRPEAAERVYELLYSQSGQWVSRDIKSIRKNRIIEEGPIQLANVGVMRAMANSKNRRVREIVWKSWISMIRYLDEAGSTRDISLGERFSMIINPKEMSVLTLAFEQVAKAAYREPMTGHDARQTSENTTDTKSRIVSNNWDFSYGRRKPGISGVGLGLLGGYFRSEMLPASGGMNDRESRAEATTRLFGLHGKHKLLVQRLLRHQEFVRPLLERRNMTIAPSGTPSEALFSLSSISIDDTLGQLKSSYQWVQEHSVPIRIEGFNAYLKGLLSHEDFKSARDVLSEFLTEQDYAFDSPCKLSVSDENASKTTLASLIPNIDTIKIVKEYKGVIGGRDTIDQIFRKGGPNLSKEWMIYSSKSYQKQASTTSDKLSSPPPLASTSLSTPTKTVVV